MDPKNAIEKSRAKFFEPNTFGSSGSNDSRMDVQVLNGHFFENV